MHPAMSMAERHQQVLIIGGGDGLAAREVLRHTNVKQVTLVDLDPRVTGLFKDNEELAKLNRFSLRDRCIINADAGKFLKQTNRHLTWSSSTCPIRTTSAGRLYRTASTPTC